MHQRQSRSRVISTLALAFSLISYGSVQALEVGGSFTIMPATGGEQLCVDSTPASSGQSASIFLSRCQNAATQRWTLTRNADGSNLLVGVAGLCLDVRVNNAPDGAPVRLGTCNFQGNQRFRVLDDGRIQEFGTGNCLMVMPDMGPGAQDPAMVIDRMRDPGAARFYVARDRAPLIAAPCHEQALQYWRMGR